MKSKFLFLILNSAFLTTDLSARAQIQQAWAVKYNNGITNGQHKALKMQLGSDGNIYVCGFSQNANSNLDYAVLKYAPNVNLLWASRFDSTNTIQAQPTGFALDPNAQTLVTGNAGTVKYDPQGNLLWTAPYAGNACASDANGNSFVTGFGTNFNTVKLSPGGTNLWTATYRDVGPTIGQTIAMDDNGNAYVAGSDVYYYFSSGPSTSYYAEAVVAKFSSLGSEVWVAAGPGGPSSTVQVAGVACTLSGNVYMLANYPIGGFGAFNTYNFSATSGNRLWGAAPNAGTGPGNAMALAPNGNIYLAGNDAFNTDVTFGLQTNGSTLWTNYYPRPTIGSSSLNADTADRANNCYITGYCAAANGTNDIVTIAYDLNGKQLWLQRYAGRGYGAVGNAIAADNSGNVYVAGYESVPGGGTETVLIKYSPVTLQHQSNGSFLLKAQGAPNEPFDIQATTNLQTWLDLGTQDANTNGLLQYLDTNAALFPWRFYLAIPQ